MYKKRLIAGLGALLLCLQTSNISTVLAIGSSNNSYDPDTMIIDFNELGTDVDLKIKLEVDNSYSQVINYSDLNHDSNGNGLLPLSNIPDNTNCSLTFIDSRYTDATNDDAIICTIENLNEYKSANGKYKLDGIYQAYNVTLNPLTENSQVSIVLNTYLNGDISLDGSFKSNDLLMLKQQLIFGYNMIQTGAYSSDDKNKTGGNILINGKNNYYCNNLNINGNIYAENSMKLICKNNPVKNNLLCYDIVWEHPYGNCHLNQSVISNPANLDDFNADILLSDDDINTLYFSSKPEVKSDTEINNQNLTINDDRAFASDISFRITNAMNLNASIKAEGNINIYGEVHNSNNAIIYSKQNITIENESTFSFTGMIYAPNGTVTIKSNNVNITGCIIAKELVIESDNVNFNINNYIINEKTNKVLSEFQLFLADMNNDGALKTSDLLSMKRILLGLDPDPTYIPYDKWNTLEDSDGDGIPDIFAFDNWSNLVDWDEDGIPDSVESYYGTNRYIKDTDNDGLTDYYELFNTYTDPIIYDSLVEGTSDGSLDLDEDGLTNIEEMKYGTNPLIKDTDEDGLSDFDELFPNPLYSQREKTDPLNPDTNDNGILDGDEKVQQTYTQKVDNNVITGISIDGSFSKNINETVSINSIADEDMNCANVVGLVGDPFEIETTSDFNASTITFDIDSTKLNDLNLDDLLLLWYDEENDNFVELNTQVNTQDSTISVNTTHFSKYMIVDKQKWFDCWRDSPKYLETYNAYTPYDTAICIDCSSSMNDNDPSFIYNQVFQNLWVNSDFDINKHTNYRELAVERYIWAMQSKDNSCIINYSDTSTIKCLFTNDKNTLINNISIRNSGGTDALDAVTKAIKQFNSKDNVNRRIILLCDGDINFDTSESDANGIIALAKQYDIKIYTIGLGAGANSTSLENLAENTGGEYFSAITADELYQKYNNILVEQYQSIDWEDNDNDGIPDHFETQGLMLSNGQIFVTDPTNPDSDGDGLLDGEEIVVTYGQKYIQGAGTNGSSISAVYFSYKSDPNNIDTDGDGINDFDDNLPLVALTEDEQIIKNFFENAELFEIEIVFKGALINCWPNILDRIKYVEVLRKCNNSTPEEYHQALYDEGLVISTNINFSMFDGYSTEYNMMSKGIDIDALYQQSWETWSDSLKIATSMWLFGVSDSYCKELAKWDYSIDYKLSLQQEQIQKSYEYINETNTIKNNPSLNINQRTTQELDDLAKDPSKGYKITDGSIKERQIGLDLERAGKLDYIIRDPNANGGAEFIDTTTGIKWDIKSFQSYPNGITSARKGAFNVSKAMVNIDKELKKGYYVIIDTRLLTIEHIEQLHKAINEANLNNYIIWYS